MKNPPHHLSPVTLFGAAVGLIDSFRAVVIGVAVVLGGSLAMTTLIGLAAIAGMLVRGAGAEEILSQLTDSFELALLCAVGGWSMSLIGGYAAAYIAGRSPVQHACWTGAMATPLSLAILTLLGDSGPVWLSALSLALILPCAALGGWLAAPVAIVSGAPDLRQ